MKLGAGRVTCQGEMMMRVELAHRCNNSLGEGIIWSAKDREIQWTDILGQTFWRFDPVSGQAITTPLDERLSCFAALGEGQLLAGFASGLARLDLSSGQRTLISEIETDRPTTRLNDGKLDRQGRFVFGTMDESAAGPSPLGHVWSYDGRTQPKRLINDVRISNSIAFSPDGTLMYFADTPNRRIDVFDYDGESGTPSNRRVFVQLGSDAGYPDGSTVDAEGYLWNAEWDGGRVVRYNPNGSIDRIVQIPVPLVTCCAFGGPDLTQLYVTTARVTLDDDTLKNAPLSGSLFVINTDIKGLCDADPLYQ